MSLVLTAWLLHSLEEQESQHRRRGSYTVLQVALEPAVWDRASDIELCCGRHARCFKNRKLLCFPFHIYFLGNSPMIRRCIWSQHCTRQGVLFLPERKECSKGKELKHQHIGGKLIGWGGKDFWRNKCSGRITKSIEKGMLGRIVAKGFTALLKGFGRTAWELRLGQGIQPYPKMKPRMVAESCRC